MENKKILITGCGGMLGEAVYHAFFKKFNDVKATDIDLNEKWLGYLDVRNYTNCEQAFNSFNPDIVLHLAALTDLEYCEENPDDAWKTNALGTENIAFLAKRHDALLVYISTAGIFGGEQESYTDFDIPNPLSVYGKSKYYGETYIQQHLEKYFIFRAGWMMGGGYRKDKKFIKKIFEQILNGATELFVVDDKFGTPTYTYNFADAILNVIDTKLYGLYNQVCSGSCNRFEVAYEFVKNLGLSKKIKITQVDSDYFKEEYFAPRPYSEKLVNLKLRSRNMDYMKGWRECLKEYSHEFIKQLDEK